MPRRGYAERGRTTDAGEERWRARWYDRDGCKASAGQGDDGEPFTTEAAALEYALRHQRIASVSSGGAPPGLRVHELLTSWLEVRRQDREVGDLTPKTYAGYESAVWAHIAPALGELELRNLTANHVESMLRQMRLDGLSRSTADGVRRVLSVALSHAEHQGLVDRNVASMVSVARDRNGRSTPSYFDEKEVAALTSVATEVHNGWMIPFAIAVGLRPGELAGLSWEDVDLSSGTMFVRRTYARVTGVGLVLSDGAKTAQSAGRRVLSADATAALRAHLKTGGGGREGPIWTKPHTREREEPNRFNFTLREMISLAGVNEIGIDGKRRSMYECRRTFASRMAAAGVPLLAVARAGGWTSPQMLAAFYAGVNDDARRAAVEAPPSFMPKSQS